MESLTLGMSPCPNDTFMFAGLLQGHVPLEGIQLHPTITDIRDLNQLAQAGSLDICKVSYYTYYHIREHYALLEAGSALGHNCGPLLIAREPLNRESLAELTTGIPGQDTTAHLLLHYFAPEARQRKVYLFHEIIPALLAGEIDAGVIIHESRFVYQHYNLYCVQDLGAYWEAETGVPIPLGGIVARTSMGITRHQQLSDAIRNSVEFAFTHPEVVMPFVRAYAQEMDEDVMKAHIELYVNTFSLGLGSSGHLAVDTLLDVASQLDAELSQILV